MERRLKLGAQDETTNYDLFWSHQLFSSLIQLMAKNIGWWRDSNQGSLVLEATALPLTTVHGYFLGWFQIQHLNDLNESRMNLNWIKNAFLYSVVYFSEWILRWKALVGNFTPLGTLTSRVQTNDWKAFWKVCFLPFVFVVVVVTHVVGCCKVWPMVVDAIKHNLGRCLLNWHNFNRSQCHKHN